MLLVARYLGLDVLLRSSPLSALISPDPPHEHTPLTRGQSTHELRMSRWQPDSYGDAHHLQVRPGFTGRRQSVSCCCSERFSSVRFSARPLLLILDVLALPRRCIRRTNRS